MILTLKIRNILRINRINRINSRIQMDQEDQVDLAVQVVTHNNKPDKATLK